LGLATGNWGFLLHGLSRDSMKICIFLIYNLLVGIIIWVLGADQRVIAFECTSGDGIHGVNLVELELNVNGNGRCLFVLLVILAIGRLIYFSATGGKENYFDFYYMVVWAY